MAPDAPRPRRTVTVAVPEDPNGEELTVPRALAERLKLVVHQGYDVIFLDVSRLSHCNSMTLGAIVQTYASAVKVGGTVKLLNVRRRFRELLGVTKIDKVIEIVEMAENPDEKAVDPDGTEMRRGSPEET
jgi:anti-anti-sigma factor